MSQEKITVIIGITAGILTSLSLLPQLIKIIKEKKSEDLSLKYLAILLSGLALWTVYGILQKDTPVIVTNAVAILINVTIIIVAARLRKH